MAFQYLPDRVTGDILSASYLNALTQNTEYLYGAAKGRNFPFQGYSHVDFTIDASKVYWYIRHRRFYLYYKMAVDADLDYIRIKVSDGTTTTTLFANETPGSTHTFEAFIDVSNLTAGLWYKIWVEADWMSGDNQLVVSRLVEVGTSSFTTATEPSYAVPPQWFRGDTVSAANMNLYKTALDACHALLGDERMTIATRQNNSEDRGYFFVNRHRWLHFIGTGQLRDVDDNEAAVVLTGDGTNVQVYDLLTIDWLVPGLLYRVDTCLIAAEDYEP